MKQTFTIYAYGPGLYTHIQARTAKEAVFKYWSDRPWMVPGTWRLRVELAGRMVLIEDAA